MEAKIEDGAITAWGSLADVAPGVRFPANGPDRAWREANGVRTIVEDITPSSSRKRIKWLSEPVLVDGVPQLVEEESYPVAERRADMKQAIRLEREARVYQPIAAVDVKGDGSVMVAPDIRDQADRDNLIALHTKALGLKARGVIAAVIRFGAADNREYTLTPDEMIAVAAAPFDRASALYVRARELKAAVDAGDHAALDRIDVAGGAIAGAGAWPS